ncbi:MAG: hypothetical protein AB1861_28755 [Cyanobacteriota bacterium]
MKPPPSLHPLPIYRVRRKVPPCFFWGKSRGTRSRMRLDAASCGDASVDAISQSDIKCRYQVQISSAIA